MNHQIDSTGRIHVSVAAAHHAVQMIQQSNRANQALILRNQGRTRYFVVPQPDLDLPAVDELVNDLGLQVERTFTIRQHRVNEDLLMFDVMIDGKQTSLSVGDDRAHMLLQCLMEIADSECEE
jgi:hypothetical protein